MATFNSHSLARMFEDFDQPPPVAPPSEPDSVEPTFSTGQLAAERELAWHEGHAAALQEATVATEAATAAALDRIADVLRATSQEAATEAAQAADAIARLLLDTLAAAFPALCAHYGAAEINMVLRTVLPALRQEPRVTVRVWPHGLEQVQAELARLDPELTSRVDVIATDAVAQGDVRVVWRAGSAERDSTKLWDAVAAVLAPAGLLTPVSRKELEHAA